MRRIREQRCLALLEGEEALQARIKADWSLTAYRRGDAEAAREQAQAALELARQIGDDSALAQACNILGIVARNDEDLPAARTYLEQALAIAHKLGARPAEAAALNNLSLLSADEGDVKQALRLAHQALAICQEQGDRHREAALHSNLADYYYQCDDIERSQEHSKHSARIMSGIGSEVPAPNPEIWKLVEW